MIATLIALALLAWLAATTFAVGDLAVLRPLRIHTLSRTERALFAIPLGLGIVSYLIFALGLLHAARFAMFVALLVLGVVAIVVRRFAPPAPSGGAAYAAGASVPLDLVGFAIGRGSAAPNGEAITGCNGTLPPAGSAPPEGAGGAKTFALVCAVLLALLALLTLLAALAPPGVMDWDALSYHLAAPKTYLAQGRIFYVPYDHHSNFPFVLEMWYLFMLGLGSAGGAKACHWLCGVLLVASVIPYVARRGVGGARVGWMAALLIAGTPIVLWEASIAYVDLATALFVWLSLYALGNGLGERARWPWLIVSALLMGFALGTKMTVLAFWGMLIVGMVGPEWLQARRLSRDSLRQAVVWGGIALAVGLPWYVKTWLYTGNPVYPFFFNLFGGRYWNAHNAALYAADQGRFGLGKSAVDLLLAPWQVVMEPTVAASLGRPFVFTEYSISGFVLSAALLALVLGAPLLVGDRRLSRTSVGLAWFAGAVFVFWFFLMQQTRYLIPALPALAVVGAEALDVAWRERRRVVTGFGVALLFASALWGAYLEGTHLTAPALPVVFGQESPDDYVTHYGPDRLGVAMTWINGNTPADAKVALFDEVRGFYLDRPYIWATPNHAAGLLPWDTYRDVDDWLADFKRRGYTTLLVNEKYAPDVDDGQRWRSLLTEAVSGDKVQLVFQAQNGRRLVNSEIVPTFVKVYRIP
jgi:4-amino-4-deoxy-L-arabinose transferase-like glycosyltransferase